MNADDKDTEVDTGSADDVRAAIEQLSKDDTVSSADVPPVQDAEVPESSAERPRDASGKFIPKSAVEPTETVAPVPETTDADRLSEQQAQPSTAAPPPTSWSADAKAIWSSLPPAAQQAALKRETEMADGQRQWSEQRQQLERTIAPLHELSQQNGIPWTEGLNRLLGVESGLRNPATAAQTVQQIAQAYGVDLAALVNGSPQPQRQQPNFDPNTIISQARDIARREAQEQLQNNALESEIQQFSTARDATGNAAHPHFENVKVLMGHLLQSGQATTMQDAYDKAIWVNADTRPKPQVPTAQPQAQQVAKSKRAAVSVSGAPNGKQGTSPKGFDADTSTRDDVREAIRMLTN